MVVLYLTTLARKSMYKPYGLLRMNPLVSVQSNLYVLCEYTLEVSEHLETLMNHT